MTSYNGNISAYWPFVRGIHRSPVNSPHKGHWRGALMFSFICATIKGWLNNREAADLRRHPACYDVTVVNLRTMLTTRQSGDNAVASKQPWALWMNNSDKATWFYHKNAHIRNPKSLTSSYIMGLTVLLVDTGPCFMLPLIWLHMSIILAMSAGGDTTLALC